MQSPFGRVRRTAALLAVALALPVATSWTQETQDEPPRESSVTERVEVRLVQMSILARDRQGRPIPDLTADDIVVKDRGTRRKVAYLNPVQKPQYDEPPPQVRLQVNAPGGSAGVPQVLETEPSYLILFIDIENDQKLQRDRATDDAMRFVKEGLDASYRVAVFSYNGQINNEIAFTADHEAVASAVRSAYDRPPRPDLDVHARMRNLMSRYEDCVVNSAAFVRTGDEQCIKDVTLEYADERRPLAEDYLNGLESVVRFAAGLAGRKTVLALSHGVAASPASDALEAARSIFGPTEQLSRIQLTVGFSEGVRTQFDSLVDLAIRRRVTLHFVDRNLAPSGDFSARQGSGMTPGSRPLLAAFEAPQFDLEELATHTGGVFLASPGDLFTGLERALDNERGAYWLGYYVDAYQTPEALRKVRVNSSRKGVRITHRRGYYERGTSLGVGGRIRLARPHKVEEEASDDRIVPFKIEADPYRLGYERTDEEAFANFTLHVMVRDHRGRLLADSFHFVNHSYPLAVWDAKGAEPITVDGFLQVPGGRYTLSAFLLNSTTGREEEFSQDFVVGAGPPGAAGSP